MTMRAVVAVSSSLAAVLLGSWLVGSPTIGFAQEPEQTDARSPEVHDETARTPNVVEQLVGPSVARWQKIGRTAASRLRSRRPEKYAADLYVFEREVVDLLEFVSKAEGITKRERERAVTQIRALLGQSAWNYRTVLDEVRRRTEDNAAGTSGSTQVEVHTVRGERRDLYFPSFHTDEKLSKAEQRRRYEAVRQQRREEHGHESPWFPLNRQTFRELNSGELVEWVQKPGGQLRLTRYAKHVDTAGGGPTPSDGSLKIYWDPTKKRPTPLVVFVSNWSGTYQPDMASVADTMVERLLKLGVPLDRIVLTPSMPVEPKTYEVFLKARGKKKQVVKRLGRELAQRVRKNEDLRRSEWRRVVERHRERAASRTARRASRSSARIKTKR